jgi:hypothetical protein
MSIYILSSLERAVYIKKRLDETEMYFKSIPFRFRTEKKEDILRWEKIFIKDWEWLRVDQ